MTEYDINKPWFYRQSFKYFFEPEGAYSSGTQSGDTKTSNSSGNTYSETHVGGNQGTGSTASQTISVPENYHAQTQKTTVLGSNATDTQETGADKSTPSGDAGKTYSETHVGGNQGTGYTADSTNSGSSSSSSNSGSSTPATTADTKALQGAATAAMGATSSAIGASEAAGLSPAQAAAAGAGKSADAYASAYPELALGYSNQEVQKAIEQMILEWQKEQAGSAQTGEWLQAGATALPYIISAIGAIASDKNLKTDIKDGKGMLSSVANAVKGKTYSYKSSPDRGEYGIIAQDLEKTPLKSTVIDTPQGKMVDTRRLTTANTGMISELSDKLDKVIGMINSGRSK